jgi:hypothetical protein
MGHFRPMPAWGRFSDFDARAVRLTPMRRHRQRGRLCPFGAITSLAFSIALKESFNGDGAVVSYLNIVCTTKEATVKLAAIASAFALSGTCALAHTVCHESHNHY